MRVKHGAVVPISFINSLSDSLSVVVVDFIASGNRFL